MSNPYKAGTPEWQEWMNAEIARHDAEQRDRDAKIDAKLREAAEKAARQNDDE